MGKSNLGVVPLPALHLLAGTSIGIMCAKYYQIEFSIFWLFPSLACLTIYLLFIRKKPFLETYLRSLFFYFFAINLGLILAGIEIYQRTYLENFARSLTESTDTLLVKATLNEIRKGEAAYSYEIEIDSILSPVVMKSPDGVKLYVKEKSEQVKRRERGSSGIFLLYPRTIPDATNPHQFSFKAYLNSKQIYGYALLDSVYEISGGAAWYHPQFFREKARSIITNYVHGDYTDIILALVLGDKSDLSFEDKQKFARSGMAHLMAVSGLHVGFIMAPFIPLFYLLRIRKHGKAGFLVIISAVLSSYLLLTGGSASVLRASLMVLLFAIAKLYSKAASNINITAVAAFLLLLINPLYLLDIGYQLSFSAVFLIFILFPPIQNALSKINLSTWLVNLLSSILLGIVIQIGLLPILAWYFNEWSLISPLTNVLALLPAQMVVIFGMLLLLLHPLPYVPTFIGWILNQMGYGLALLSEQFSGDTFFIIVEKPMPILFVIWFYLLYSVHHWYDKKRRKFGVTTAIVLGLIVMSISRIQSKSNIFSIVVFDVGQGDAFLLTTPTGKYYLIDTGVWTPTWNSGNGILLPYLKAEGITRLHGIFITHPHADHLGGTTPLLHSLEVDSLYLSTKEYDSGIFHKMVNLADSTNTGIRLLSIESKIELDDNLFSTVLWPPAKYHNENINNLSLVLYIVHGEVRFLFTGDLESEAEENLTLYYSELLKVDWLKVAHHGSRTGSTSKFLTATQPDFAVVSNAYQNKYRHPHGEVSYRLHSDSVDVHYTALDGAVKYISDGKKIVKLHLEE